MTGFAWSVQRLKAMSAAEVAWRVSQKALQEKEKNRFKKRRTAITEKLFNEQLSDLKPDENRMQLNWENRAFSLNTEIPLPGGYDYRLYRKSWDAGFQTGNDWPKQFSYHLDYKQRGDIGDARTNWELNRHFQFAILAKDYFAGGDRKYLAEFSELFCDWNEANPFLWGISWTDVMEIAIRCSNWCYAWCFLKKTDAPEELLKQLQTGILNMTDYVVKHYARYSSANNHLIIEAYSIGQTGILFDYQPWIDLSVSILSGELSRQNYSDGINKELSLHYQSFYMEAMGLMLRLLIKNKLQVPGPWISMLDKMCIYVSDCMGNYGETAAFGDDDEGKVLDLHGGQNYHQYVLGLFTLMLDRQYIGTDLLRNENLAWLFSDDERIRAQKKEPYLPPLSVCYEEGGNTILRSNDRTVLIAIDHAALGFGSIAAHGHADALSFQMYVKGHPVFVDPGTYIYHGDSEYRNYFRKTENHNTVCINGEDQSEMLGAFLWGKKAETKIINRHFGSSGIMLELMTQGYLSSFKRKFEFDGSVLVITDSALREGSVVTFNIGPNDGISKAEDRILITIENNCVSLSFAGADEVLLTDSWYSPAYGMKERIKALKVKTASEQLVSRIEVLT